MALLLPLPPPVSKMCRYPFQPRSILETPLSLSLSLSLCLWIDQHCSRRIEWHSQKRTHLSNVYTICFANRIYLLLSQDEVDCTACFLSGVDNPHKFKRNELELQHRQWIAEKLARMGVADGGDMPPTPVAITPKPRGWSPYLVMHISQLASQSLHVSHLPHLMDAVPQQILDEWSHF